MSWCLIAPGSEVQSLALVVRVWDVLYRVHFALQPMFLE